MRTLRIEFLENETVYLDGVIAGNQGEHLATRLIISLPDNLIDFKPDYYIVSFETFKNNKKYCSQAITQGGYSDSAYLLGNKIYIDIPIEATATSGCNIVVDGVKSIEGNVKELTKSPIIKLTFRKSISKKTRTDLSNLPSPLTVAQRGLSAYEVAADNGFQGTENEWLTSIRGIDVKSASINPNDKHLLLKMSDNTTKDCGAVAVPVTDNLTSTNPTDALSANQGRVLNEIKADKEVVNKLLVKNIPPTEEDDITKNIIVGDTWTVPSITFHNLIKNATDLQTSDWTGTYCNVEKSLAGVHLIENGSGEFYAYAKCETTQTVKAGHKYYVCGDITFSNVDICKLIVKVGDIELDKIQKGDTNKLGDTFIAPDDVTGELYISPVMINSTEPLNGSEMSISNLYLIDLTEDMGAGFEFTKEQSSAYFNNVFQIKLYEHSGFYQCSDNNESSAMWLRVDDYLQSQIDNIVDYPVERGTDGIWTWKKYASGDAECWGVTQVNSAKDDGQSILPTTDLNLPFDFKTIDYASANAFNNSWKLERTYVKLLEASPHKQIRAVCYTLEYIPTATDQFVSINIKGSWK